MLPLFSFRQNTCLLYPLCCRLNGSRVLFNSCSSVLPLPSEHVFLQVFWTREFKSQWAPYPLLVFGPSRHVLSVLLLPLRVSSRRFDFYIRLPRICTVYGVTLPPRCCFLERSPRLFASSACPLPAKRSKAMSLYLFNTPSPKFLPLQTLCLVRTCLPPFCFMRYCPFFIPSLRVRKG